VCGHIKLETASWNLRDGSQQLRLIQPLVCDSG
jgi:hypothetical protein